MPKNPFNTNNFTQTIRRFEGTPGGSGGGARSKGYTYQVSGAGSGAANRQLRNAAKRGDTRAINRIGRQYGGWNRRAGGGAAGRGRR